jgi:hypothetical protein
MPRPVVTKAVMAALVVWVVVRGVAAACYPHVVRLAVM